MATSATYSLGPSPCSSAAAVSAPVAVSPALAPDGGSPFSSGAPAAPAGASTPAALVAAVMEKNKISKNYSPVLVEHLLPVLIIT